MYCFELKERLNFADFSLAFVIQHVHRRHLKSSCSNSLKPRFFDPMNIFTFGVSLFNRNTTL